MHITDLTGTKWLLNETIEYDDNFPTYNINFNAYCESGAVASLSELYMEAVAGPRQQSLRTVEPPASTSILYCLRYTSSDSIDFYNFWTGNVLYTGNDTTSMTNSANDSTFNGELFNRTIEITGGTDVTNSVLISWLQSNATQIVEPTVTNTFSIGNIPVTNMYVGTRQVRKIYIGNVLVWEKEIEPVPDNALLVQDGKLFTSNGGYLITTEVTMISFTINGNPYQAEEGMTWQEWVNSEYNTDGFIVNGDAIWTSSYGLTVSLNGVYVTPSDTILAAPYSVAGGGAN